MNLGLYQEKGNTTISNLNCHHRILQGDGSYKLIRVLFFFTKFKLKKTYVIRLKNKNCVMIITLL